MDYDIIFSDRKTVSLSIKEGRLTVRAPRGASSRDVKKIVEKNSDWIEKHLEKSKAKCERFSSLTDSDISALKKSAKAYFKNKTEEYAKIMGIKYGRITITSAKTRFGACSSKGNISYSYRLMLYPDAAKEYVVVHELCHRIHMNHSKDFYRLLESFMPDYKERRKLLKS